jgi:hypothetical protein
MNPPGGGSAPDDSPGRRVVDHSDSARVAQATGMLMELFGLGVHEALALLYVVSSMKFLRPSSVARELVERWRAMA